MPIFKALAVKLLDTRLKTNHIYFKKQHILLYAFPVTKKKRYNIMAPLVVHLKKPHRGTPDI